MLQVATHILHSTSRAAVVQNPLRNVLQSSSTPSNLGARNGPGNSNWNGHGTGAGSTKQNTGSRYYSFNTAGRAVSQANAVSSNIDGTFFDENEEHVPRRVVVIEDQAKRTRLRSSSSSVSQSKSVSSSSVLKALQLHARSPFLSTRAIEAALKPTPSLLTRPRRNSTSSSDGLYRPASPIRHNSTVAAAESGSPNVEEVALRPRRNSTSSVDSIDRSAVEFSSTLGLDEHISSPRRNSTSSVDESDQSSNDGDASVETKPTSAPQSPRSNSSSARPEVRFPALAQAKEARDPHAVAEAVAHFRVTARNPTIHDFNLALEALYLTRGGESIIPMFETYNDMLSRSIFPNDFTYSLLILALTARDVELSRTLRDLADAEKRHSYFGQAAQEEVDALRNRMDILRSESGDNFSSMMTLFYAANSHRKPSFPLNLYFQLIRSCAIHSNVQAAAHVFNGLEKNFDNLKPFLFEYMIEVYGNSGDIAGAEQVFQYYTKLGQENRLHQDAHHAHDQEDHLENWNAMITAYFKCGQPERAIGLLDQMMRSPAGKNFGLADVPLPASSTYTAVLTGFCEIGDLQTAWTWFERLRQQGIVTADPYEFSDQPIQPDVYASYALVEAFAKHSMLMEMNEAFRHVRPKLKSYSALPIVIYHATMRRIPDMDDAQAKESLEFLRAEITEGIIKYAYRSVVIEQITVEYLRRGMLEDAMTTYLEFFDRRMQPVHAGSAKDPELNHVTIKLLRSTFSHFQKNFLKAAADQRALTFRHSLMLMKISEIVGVGFTHLYRKHILQSYLDAKATNSVPIAEMTLKDWQRLLETAIQAENLQASSLPNDLPSDTPTTGGVLSLLEDFASMNVEFDSISPAVVSKAIRHLVSVYGPSHLVGVFQNLGPPFQRALEESEEVRMLAVEGLLSDLPQSSPRNERTEMLLDSYGNLVVDSKQNRYVGESLLHKHDRPSVLEAYVRLRRLVDNERKVPGLGVLGNLIQALGRQGELDKVKEVYTIAQDALKSMRLQDDDLKKGWIGIEDNMVIALAHAGDIDGAHVHRARILEQGGAPSADAYGALILYVKDTTDDASNAMMLYREARYVGTQMNIYFYNNIISKLAKARKADHALELFQRMKTQHIPPSSITYGALIGACARVGDVHSAEALFAEMISQPRFRPRVPPYNTMMQLYTMTKPNRERALYFYNQLVRAGVKPTAHTYKLLLDAYGSIEPVDIASMETIFEQLKADASVQVQGTHYASLINAYGCVQRDLHKAISVFDTIPSDNPSALDAVVFESIVNALVTHRRTELIPEYISKMHAAGVRMTAYIANFLIKGYAITGEIQKARDIFESLVDPPTGLAAPNNHAPHDPSPGAATDNMEFVYREPSTWEAMVRAELGAGHRDRALDLLERLKTRQYPVAVYNRISGVMVDHSSALR